VEGADVRSIAGAEPTLESVRDLVRRARARHPEQELHVVIEAGSEHWVWLFHAAGTTVFVVDPKQAKAFAESLHSSGAKDDSRDSGTLAQLGLSPSHAKEPWAPSSELHSQLAVLASGHEQLINDLGRAQQRLRDLLRAHMPVVNGALRDVSTAWVATVLKAIPTPWHARKLTRPEFDQLLAGSGSRQKSRDALWNAIQATEAPWLGESQARAIALRVGQLVDQIQQLVAQLAEVDRELDVLTQPMKVRSILESLDGIGLNLSVALILFGVGDVSTDRDQLSVQMGASPVFIGSGRTQKGKAKGHAVMRRAAPPRARASVFLLGRLASQRLDWAIEMYKDARSRGQKAATAYRRIARSVLRIVSAMVRTGHEYDNARYVRALQQKGVRWAAGLTVPLLPVATGTP
jgi:transposase